MSVQIASGCTFWLQNQTCKKAFSDAITGFMLIDSKWSCFNMSNSTWSSTAQCYEKIKGHFTHPISQSNFTVWCDLDRNNPAQNLHKILLHVPKWFCSVFVAKIFPIALAKMQIIHFKLIQIPSDFVVGLSNRTCK